MSETVIFSCGGCDATWTAQGVCHCSACHRTFAGFWLFDAHRTLAGEHGACRDPATVTYNGKRRLFLREDGVWHGPQMDDDERSRARRGWARS